MFRDCYFEYAGQYSGDYNLVMMYVENSYDKFDSGGQYEVATDVLPASAETLLYGLKYSEKPLEFSIEIINPDKAIPFEQMKEIKDWLFGQDGWKKLKLHSSEYQDYHLKCLLIPEEDIVDATGYRGVRCTLKNISAYWYGEDKTIAYDKAKIIELAGENGDNLYDSGALWLNVNIDSHSPSKIFPIIKFQMTTKGASAYERDDDYMDFYVLNRTLKEDSSISIRIPQEVRARIFTFDCKYATLGDYSSGNLSYQPNSTSNDIFFFVKGNNRFAIQMRNLIEENGVRQFAPYEYISFTYTPMYRIGGF